MQTHTFTRALLTLSLAFITTACEDFDDVVIPASDNQVPVAGTRFISSGQGLDTVRFGSWTQTTQAGDVFAILPFGYDTGGIQRLEINISGQRNCDLGGGIGQITHEDSPTIVQEFTADVGDTVSNGAYDILQFSAGYSENCSHYKSWNVTATDFHGNSTQASGSISYSP